MKPHDLIPQLFRTEYRKIVAVLCKRFGINQLEAAEDVTSETFLLASETWGLKGIPDNPEGWLYTVAKNKILDQIKRNRLFEEKISSHLSPPHEFLPPPELDLSARNIEDSQLRMMFAVCHPSIPEEAQIGLALRILCGLGIEEIADAFLSNKEAVNKRLHRAKQKLKQQVTNLEMPGTSETQHRLSTIIRMIYLLFNEGYYSRSNNNTLRKNLCIDAMQLTQILLNHQPTAKPEVYALMALMCFHTSRFDARTNAAGEMVLYEDQDQSRWNHDLILKGELFMNQAATGDQASTYHLQAAIAYWHTRKDSDSEKWENILQLYNYLLQVEYSPIAALNRTYALSKARSISEAIIEAEKLELKGNQFFHTLLGTLYSENHPQKAISHYTQALILARTEADKRIIKEKLNSF